MKVHLIQEQKEAFKAFLFNQSEQEDLNLFYETVANWQDHWNLEATDLISTYDQSLYSSTSHRLWGGRVNSPKSAMLELLNHDKEFARVAFRDLLNEDKDLGLRLDRFLFHLDEMTIQLKKKQQRFIGHLHIDKTYICLYLALAFPEKYCLWNYKAFSATVAIFEIPQIPQAVEIDRYYKLCRGIHNVLIKDPEVFQLLAMRTKNFNANYLTYMPVFLNFVDKNSSK